MPKDKVRKTGAQESRWVTVRIPSSARPLMDTLRAVAAQHGWARLGATRDDAPSNANILEEALRTLDNVRQQEEDRLASRSGRRG